jgi:hypothetical protein
MKSASLKEIKTELSRLHPDTLMELCIRVAKYKKENKELFSYLLFEAGNEKAYISEVKAEMDELFTEVNKSNSYLAKKTIRKILRLTNKHIKYSGSKQTEVELLIHFCKKLKRLGISMPMNSTLGNLYYRQYQNIKKALATLHEDLQFDYEDEIKGL